MQKIFNRSFLSKYGPIIVGLILIAALILLPTGYEDNIVYQESIISPARVLSTDESLVVDTGLVRSGDQICELEILSGRFKGEICEGNNGLNGSLEQDKLFAVGDKALVRINYEGERNSQCLHDRPLPHPRRAHTGRAFLCASGPICRAHRR